MPTLSGIFINTELRVGMRVSFRKPTIKAYNSSHAETQRRRGKRGVAPNQCRLVSIASDIPIYISQSTSSQFKLFSAPLEPLKSTLLVPTYFRIQAALRSWENRRLVRKSQDEIG